MYSREVLAILRREGLDVSRERLRGAREARALKPRPLTDIFGRYQYRRVHISQFRAYVNEIRTGPRAAHLGPGGREMAEMKREEKAAKLRQNDAAIGQLEAIQKRTKT